jgi:hypothetical protein
MSWDGRSSLASPAERGAAIRAQREAEAQHTRERQQEMANTEKTPTGVVRKTLRTTEAKSAVGGLNQKLDAALEEVRLAFQREAQANHAEAMETNADAKRAPMIGNRRTVN